MPWPSRAHAAATCAIACFTACAPAAEPCHDGSDCSDEARCEAGVCVVGSGDVAPAPGPPVAPPTAPAFEHSRAIVIPAGRVSDKLFGFPVVVAVKSDNLRSLAAGGQVRGPGDIAFVQGDQLLYADIEEWDGDAGHLTAWVQLPVLASATDTAFALVWGLDADVDSRPNAVWLGKYFAVWHLGEDPDDDDFVDATGRGNDGASEGLHHRNRVGGVAGHAVEIDDTDEAVVIDSEDLNRAGSTTVEAWVRVDTLDSVMRVFHRGGRFDNILDLLVMRGVQAARVAGAFSVGAAGTVPSTLDVPTFELGTWHQLVGVFDEASENAALYVDGKARATSVLRASSVAPSTISTIGNSPADDGYDEVDSVVDEVRVGQVALPPAWIAASYANVSDPGFLVLGPNP